MSEQLDTHSSASRQHWIETGDYLREGEALTVAPRRRQLCDECAVDLDIGGVMAHHCPECGR